MDNYLDNFASFVIRLEENVCENTCRVMRFAHHDCGGGVPAGSHWSECYVPDITAD
jgi:hypothetical protein